MGIGTIQNKTIDILTSELGMGFERVLPLSQLPPKKISVFLN